MSTYSRNEWELEMIWRKSQRPAEERRDIERRVIQEFIFALMGPGLTPSKVTRELRAVAPKDLSCIVTR